MARLDRNRANWFQELDDFVTHSHIDTHVSSSISSSLEVDDWLIEYAANEDTIQHSPDFLAHNAVALRLGIISAA